MRSGKRIISIILCIFILSGGIMLPEGKAYASGIKYIFIGDSRLCGMANSFGIGNTRTTRYGGDGTQVIRSSGDIYWCAEVGTYIGRFRSTVNSILQQFTPGSAVIVYALGANNPVSIDQDIAYCNSLVDSGWEVYLCDVLPVNDRKSYAIKEYMVRNANSKIYAGEGKYKVIRYHDEADIGRTDSMGIHFDSVTYKAWYDAIIKKVNEPDMKNYTSVFNAEYYVTRYTDLNKAYGNDSGKAFNHFMNFGIKEARSGAAAFDVAYYKNTYADLRAVYGDDNMKYMEHFRKFGIKEGRQGSDTFNVFSYRNLYSDLRQTYGDDLEKYYEHYNKFGYKEGRKAVGTTEIVNPVTRIGLTDYSLIYDYYYYVNRYPDVKKYFYNDDMGALYHFLNHGIDEGRQAKASFDPWAYKNAHPDLRAKFGNNIEEYYYHYMSYGYREKRKSTDCPNVVGATTVYNGFDYSPVYNYYYYTERYPDIKRTYGNNDAAALRHFVTFGMKEGRQGSAEFSLSLYKSRYSDVVAAYGDNNSKYYYHYINAGKREKEEKEIKQVQGL